MFDLKKDKINKILEKNVAETKEKFQLNLKQKSEFQL